MGTILETAANIVRNHSQKHSWQGRSAVLECREGHLCVRGFLTYQGTELYPDGRKKARFILSAEDQTFEVVAFGSRADRITPEDCFELVIVSARIVKGLWIMDRDVVLACAD